MGRTQNKVEGVIYKCDVDTDKSTRIKDVPDKLVVGRIEGAWTDKVYFSKGSTAFSKSNVSFDATSMHPVAKFSPRTRFCSWM